MWCVEVLETVNETPIMNAETDNCKYVCGCAEQKPVNAKKPIKVLILASQKRHELFAPDMPIRKTAELVFCDRNGTEADFLTAGADADALFVSPITPIPRSTIEQMPNLKMIHSQGVGFDRIDLNAAKERGIYVCNNAGCNASAVAELAIMLMSMLLHRILWGDHMVRAGRQKDALKAMEVDIPSDLSLCAVGLIGFGHIAQATAARLRPFGSKLYYYSRHRKPLELEAQFGIAYLPLYELAETCDIVSLHLPANTESVHLIDCNFLRHMKPTAFLINTARGAIIDDAALCDALRNGTIAGAGLDVYSPEPVTADHPLVSLAHELPDKLVLSPHQGGVSKPAFYAAHSMLFDNLQRLADGKRPERIVNGL